jgi:hypothetical protein
MNDINVQPYIDKLELLKEYMNLWIITDGVPLIMINIDALPHISTKQIMDIWNQCGVLVGRANNNYPASSKLSFDEWLIWRDDDIMRRAEVA